MNPKKRIQRRHRAFRRRVNELLVGLVTARWLARAMWRGWRAAS